jgi:hypothetical protein
LFLLNSSKTDIDAAVAVDASCRPVEFLNPESSNAKLVTMLGRTSHLSGALNRAYLGNATGPSGALIPLA